MNFTHPNDIYREDDPKDWLTSALFFSSALGSILKNGEGVAVVAKNELANLVEGTCYIVYRKGKQIVIEESDDEYENGQMVWIDDVPVKE